MIGIVGKGDGPGVGVRVESYPQPHPEEASAAPVLTQGPKSATDRDLADLKVKVAERWAILDSTYHPPAENGYTLKISRHLDSSSSEWTWIGLYQAVAFSGKTRGGFYFGTGVAFEGASPNDDVVKLVNKLFGDTMEKLFTDGRMSRSVFNLNLASLELKPLGSGIPLPEHEGLDPWSERGKFLPLPSFDTTTIQREVHRALWSMDYRAYSTLYITNWTDPRMNAEFYVPVEAPPKDQQRSRAWVPDADDVGSAAETGASHAPQEPNVVSQEWNLPGSQSEAAPVYGDNDLIIRKLNEILQRMRNIETQLMNALDARHSAEYPLHDSPVKSETSYTEFAIIAAFVFSAIVIIVMMIEARGGFGWP